MQKVSANKTFLLLSEGTLKYVHEWKQIMSDKRIITMRTVVFKGQTTIYAIHWIHKSSICCILWDISETISTDTAGKFIG